MVYTVVIARYNEDISWLDEINNINIDIIIYNKGEKIENCKYKQIMLPNIGRESHTYLYHIINNYDNISEKTFFLQGRIDDHILYYEMTLKKSFNLNELFNFNDHSKICMQYPLADGHDANGHILFWRSKCEQSQYNVWQWFNKFIDKNEDIFTSKNIYCAALFGVHKKYILLRTKEYYETLILQLYSINPEITHFFERSWFYLFNLHKINIINNPTHIVVGSGLSGAVIAEQLSHIKNSRILIIEKRNHIGGNCYDYIDKETNLRISKYGIHIFHTDNEQVWKYINKFSNWIPYTFKVNGYSDNKYFPVPININTINILCNQSLKTENDMLLYLDLVRDKSIIEPKNSEEFCLSKFGKELYEKIFKYYTFKQWNKYPEELDVTVLKRIPLRFDHENKYFNDKYQVLPENGYTEFINNIIQSNSNISVLYNTNFNEYKKNNNINNINNIKIFYTGAIDNYYTELNLPKLEYRSINFEAEILKNTDFYQNNIVINHTDLTNKYTRVVEYKHLPNQISNDTIIIKEYTTDIGEPYYPVPNKQNQDLYEQYKQVAIKDKNIIFLGRLASYKYFNMDEAILNSLNVFEQYKRDNNIDIN